jgi:hypothetical protein
VKSPKERKKGRGPASTIAANTGSSRWLHGKVVLSVLLFVLLVAYANSFQAGLVMDNKVLLAQDSRISALSWHNLRLIFTQDYWYTSSISGLYRPFSTLSYLFNYAILGNGPQPPGYHWINFLLHAANAALVYALGLAILGETMPAAALAAIWGLHPIQTEAVTNIIGRSDLLAATGVLAGLLCHIRSTAAAGGRRMLWLALLAAAGALAIFSKESGIVLVAAMAVYDLLYGVRASWRMHAWSYAALAPVFGLFFYLREQAFANLPPVHFPFGDNPLTGAGFIAARWTAIDVIGRYIGLLVWPQHLSCDHSYHQIPIAGWTAWPAFLVCVGAVGAALLWRRRRPAVSFFILWFFICLAPTSNLVLQIGTVMAERFLYLPSVGFAGCVVIGVLALYRRRPAWNAPALLAGICLVLAVRTYARNADWQSDYTLWASAVRSSPDSYKTHMALASAVADAGPQGLSLALDEIRRSLAILRDLPDARSTPVPYIDASSYLGQKADQGADSGSLYDEALGLLLHARRIEAANNEEHARQDRLRGQTPGPVTWVELYLQLGAVYLRKNDLARALEALEYGRDRRPVPAFFEQISVAQFRAGDLHGAALTLFEGRSMFPEYAKFSEGLVRLYGTLDPQGCALRKENGGVALNLGCPRVYADACTAADTVVQRCRRMGQQDAADDVERRVIRGLGCQPGLPHTAR